MGRTHAYTCHLQGHQEGAAVGLHCINHGINPANGCRWGRPGNVAKQVRWDLGDHRNSRKPQMLAGEEEIPLLQPI